MKAANFDSLTYANRLKAAGMDGGLAEVQASVMTEVIQDHFHSLSTKQELQQLGLDLRKEIQLLRLEVQKDMQLLEQRMVIKLGSLMVLAIGVVASVVKLFSKTTKALKSFTLVWVGPLTTKSPKASKNR
jgi:hypothetical protein